MDHIQESNDSDYKYRATAPREDVAKAFMQAIKEIDYSNFKDEVQKRQGYGRASVYGWVWDSLYTIQKEEDLRG
jgi:Fe2+ or Zn2+ uptake regulation protein